MFQFRPAHERGSFDHGWLQTSHTFSFGNYDDPLHTSFGSLRVMNEDVVQPGRGFGMHGHRDMEIVTYVLSGELEHRDNIGHAERIRPGEFQRMTAGRGIQHSEANPSHTDPVHLYQIWLQPRAKGLDPSYDQRWFDPLHRRDQWQVVASADGRENSLVIEQDATLQIASISAGQSVSYRWNPNRRYWLQVTQGSGELVRGEPGTSQLVVAGDGAGFSNETELVIHGGPDGMEVLLFDLA